VQNKHGDDYTPPQAATEYPGLDDAGFVVVV